MPIEFHTCKSAQLKVTLLASYLTIPALGLKASFAWVNQLSLNK
jgi:hypothetical protein